MTQTDTPENEPTVGEAVSETAEEWMYRDDEFLLEEDREYVLRDEGWSWKSWISPVLFGLGLVVLVGDALPVSMRLSMGVEPVHPFTGPLVAEIGLGGLVVLKATAAMFVLLVPEITSDAEQAVRAGAAGGVMVCLVVAVLSAWSLLAV